MSLYEPSLPARPFQKGLDLAGRVSWIASTSEFCAHAEIDTQRPTEQRLNRELKPEHIVSGELRPLLHLAAYQRRAVLEAASAGGFGWCCNVVHHCHSTNELRLVADIQIAPAETSLT